MNTKDFKLLIISGHGEADPGACANGYREAECTRALARLVQSEAIRQGITSTLYDQGKNAVTRIKAGQLPPFAGKNLCLEIHLNASGTQDNAGNGAMIGSMCYEKTGTKALPAAQAILDGLYAIGSKKAWDGIVDTARQYSAGLLVQNTSESQGVPHVLLETCFITDMDDMRWLNGNQDRIAAAIVQAIINTYGLTGGDQPVPAPARTINGTVTVDYSGPDGLSLRDSNDFTAGSVVSKLKLGDQRRAVERVTAKTGEAMYRLEDGHYITGAEKYVHYTENAFSGFVGRTDSPDGSLTVRDFPSSRDNGGKVIFTLYNGNMFDVIGEAYNVGDHWYQIRIKNDSVDLIGWVAARFVNK